MNAPLRSKLLVAVQTGCCMVLIWWAWRAVWECPWLIAGVVAGVTINVSAILAMRVSQVKVTPEPGEEAELCERGVYRFVRHPMYAGLLLAMAMFAIPSGWLPGGGFWILLWLVLREKMRMEERYWHQRDEKYADYMKRTKRLVPGIW